MTSARANLAAALAAADAAEAIALGDRLSAGLQIRHRTVPQAGLHLLTMEDAVFGEAYHLGEIPVASACVEILIPEGEPVIGGAIIVGDDARLATALAVCDGVWAGRLPGWEDVDALAASGQAGRDRLEAVRADARARTLVSFAELADDDQPAGATR